MVQRNLASVARALIVVLAIAPLAIALNLWPETGVLTDALAASKSWVAQVVASAFFLCSATLEYWALGRWQGLLACPLYVLVIGSTINMEPTRRGDEACDWQCVLHRSSLAALGVAELALLWTRDFGPLVLFATALAIGATISTFLITVDRGGANFTADEQESLLRLVGSMELMTLLWVRTLAATTPSAKSELVEYVRV